MGTLDDELAGRVQSADRGDALPALSSALSRQGNALEGLTVALEGARIAAGARDPLQEARCLSLAGDAYIELSDPGEALTTFQLALVRMDGLDEPNLEAAILHAAGWAMKEVGRPAAGRDLALRAVKCAGGPEGREIRADALVSLGDIELSIAEGLPGSPERDAVLDRAHAALSEAQQLSRDAGIDDIEARALGNEGAVWALRGDHERAIAVQERALASMLACEDVAAAIEALLRIGRSERELGRTEQAVERLQACLALTAQNAAPYDELRAHEELALIADGAGDFEQAYRHMVTVWRLARQIADERAVRSAELLALRVAAEDSSREAAQLREHSRTLTELSGELERERELFAQQALLDPLTRLANRRALEQTIAALDRDAPGVVQTVAIADIDRFKAINDRFGHAVGDEVLRAVAAILERFARREDLACRYGGEEFVLLLGSRDARAGELVSERIRVAIEANDWSAIAPELAVTISIGVAVGIAADVATLLRHADKLLYRAKHEGRNQVVSADFSPPGRRADAR